MRPISLRSDHSLPPQRRKHRPITIPVVIAIVFIFGLTFHYASPFASNPSSLSSSSTSQKPLNYLNGTQYSQQNPFAFCPLYNPQDRIGLKYGASALEQSRLHLGSGGRVQRVIKKALAGQPVTISVIGGSVSACHGAGDEPVSSSCYPALFFNWWNSIFPHPATELTNGALRRTSSAYYGYCSAHHIPDVTDLVIVELDVDDSLNKNTVNDFEILIRSLLLRPDQPAVIVLGHFSPQVHETHGFAGPDHWHNVVAQFYDVPHISIKQTLLNHLLTSPAALKPYFADPVLASPLGHTLIADTLSAYIQMQICHVWASLTSTVPILPINPGAPSDGTSEKKGLFAGVGQRKGVPPEDNNKKPGGGEGDSGWKPPGDEDLDSDGLPKNGGSQQQQAAITANKPKHPVPPGFISTSSANADIVEIQPMCVSANDLINPLPPSLFYGSGWFTHHPPQATSTATQTSMSHYWHSTLPTSRLRIPIQLGRGDVGVYYIKEPMSSIGEGSAVECWVDDNYAGAKVLENAADIDEPQAALEMIDSNVAPGSHYVECTLMGDEGTGVPIFKIIGIFAT